MKVEYSEDLKIAYFDGYKFRRDAKTGYYLATKPTCQGKRERLHCYVWRYHNGIIPAGYHIHHVDRDKSHNDIDNLRCIPEKIHVRHHRAEYVANNYDEIVENIKTKAAPKAAEWHRSEAGRAWHSKHAKQTIENMGKKEYVCQMCGKKFFALPIGMEKKFCSNACKSAARRKSGVDNEKRNCAVCGKEFFAGKYTKNKTCSRKCEIVLRRNKRDKAAREAIGLQHGS